MAALTEERQDTHERVGRARSVPVAASTAIYAGAGVVLNSSGYAVPASTATGLKTLGRAEETVDNSAGVAGAKNVDVLGGVFAFGNSAGADEIATADIESECFWVDDQTVALTDGTGTRSRAGVIFDVNSDGVWVDTLR